MRAVTRSAIVDGIWRIVAISALMLPGTRLAWGDGGRAGDGGPAGDDYRTEVRAGGVRAGDPDEAGEGRAVAAVGRRRMDEAQAGSTPDALRWSPGVSVQQTAHGQASPYLRGVTGRQTLLLFDGLGLSHALFRHGPNQYLFTVDPQTVEAVEVLRGSAGVELGAGAIGGAIWVRPRTPALLPGVAGLQVRPLLAWRHATAEGGHAGRVEAEVQAGPAWAALLGAGGRTAGRLESAGPVGHLVAPESLGGLAIEKEVPRLHDDGRTQLGTGFDVVTADARVVRALGGLGRLTLAGYAFRQYDAPRTDQCPPPESPAAWCLLYEEQFRTHAYARTDLLPGAALAERLSAALSFQRHHERRTNDRGFVVTGGRDDIDVVEARARLHAREIPIADGVELRIPYGADGTVERVSSAAWTALPRSGVLRTASRGQYLEGSRYVQGGAWVAPRLHLGDAWTLRAGLRRASAAARAPGDAASDTAAVDGAWSAWVGAGGAAWRPRPGVTLRLNLDQGFRAPNLDDLTARQLTGQGRQLENPDLRPERSTSLDLGVRLEGRRWFAEAWAFRTWLQGAMERRDATCPAGDRECVAARRSPPVRLVNLPGDAHLVGAEADAGWRSAGGLELRAFASAARGDGPSPLPAEQDGTRPLSRVPPLSGGVEATWRPRASAAYVGGGVRWSGAQDRLSFGDTLDTRIPFGGTPGFTVADLRAGVRWADRARLSAVLENILDAPWRVHGSGVLGAGTGIVLTLEVTP